MPKLLFVVNEAYFFMTHRLAVAMAAAEAGYEIHVAAPSHHTWAPDDFSVDTLTEAGVIWHELPLSRRGTNPLEELRTLHALIKIFRMLSPDIIHLLTIKPMLYGGIAARVTGMKAVVGTVTGLGQVFSGKGFKAGLLRVLVKVLYRLALGHPNMAVIVQNSADGDELVRVGVAARERLSLIRGSGVSLDEFTCSDDPGGQPVVILAARLIWEKGVGEFAAAAERLLAEGINARFVLVGDTRSDNPRAVPAERIRALCEAGTIEWWGRRTDMANVLGSCHIVCLPTSYGEGVPRILIEAAASGRPIVATDIPGCLEVTKHGETGIVVPVHDIDALTEALRSLISNPAKRSEMGKKGRLLVERELSEDIVVSKTLKVYEDVGTGTVSTKDR